MYRQYTLPINSDADKYEASEAKGLAKRAPLFWCICTLYTLYRKSLCGGLLHA